MDENRNAQCVLVENLEGKRLIGRTKCKYTDKSKTHLKETELGDVSQDREKWCTLANMVITFQIPHTVRNFMSR